MQNSANQNYYLKFSITSNAIYFLLRNVLQGHICSESLIFSTKNRQNNSHVEKNVLIFFSSLFNTYTQKVLLILVDLRECTWLKIKVIVLMNKL